MSSGRVYVIGAGLAGLSAAMHLAELGATITLIEGANQAGGRCRSYFDAALDQVIDNGNHLVLSGNPAVSRYVQKIGATQLLTGPEHARFAFFDTRSGARWTIRPNDGPLAWWILAPKRRVPGTSPRDYLSILNLLIARPDAPVESVISCHGALWENLLAPLLLAALNTDPRTASAGLAAAVLRQTLFKGGRAYCPRIATPHLADAFITPALAHLARQKTRIILGKRVRKLQFEADRVTSLELAGESIALAREDKIVLAVPAWVAADLVPGVCVPDAFRSIINGHFALPAPPNAEPILGVIGGVAEWIFAFSDRLSVTVSGADRLLDEDRDSLARRLWADVARAHGLTCPLPRWQIVKERRATFAATPEQDRRRPGPVTSWRNLVLAGDWVRTGLPATIEGALRSGETAAQLILRGDRA
ncbi:MAG: hydroxysqualene dehydroxylase HpnE [Alphaproteobacteria bacterium]|nr:hydroxysqualene dehydroxylase HpnE [Alphaproteobacteria bacterium]